MKRKSISILLMSLTLAWLGLGAITGCKESGGGGSGSTSNPNSPGDELPSQPNYTGTWSGATDQGKPLSFTVQEIASYDITELTYFIQTNGATCSADLQGTISSLLIPINNKEAIVNGSGDNFTVEFHFYFDSETECHGTWTAVDNACGANNSGTFTASKQENPLPACTDADNDGYFAQADCGTAIDCDDNNPAIYPSAAEVCGDGIDNNCDGQTDEDCQVPPPPSATLNVPADYSTIQAAIDAAKDGETVLVADGTYNETIDFKGKAISVKSENGANNTTIKAASGSVVYFYNGETDESVLDGFTLTGGNGRQIYDGVSKIFGYGGGVYCSYSSSPIIKNCIITNNLTTGEGGGVYVGINSSPQLIDTRIYSNRAAGGGGLYAENAKDIKLIGCTVEKNKAGVGAGIGSVSGLNLYIDKTYIINNAATSKGGGIYCQQTTATITNSIIAQNSVADYHLVYGGGLYLAYYSSAEIVNTTIADNILSGAGGGYGGGIYINPDNPPYSISSATLVNSIVWGNRANTGEHQIGGAVSKISATYSDIESGFFGTGNITADPLFVGSGNYHLTAGSPCIDAGTSSNAPTDDIDGEARPKGSGIDIGADEF